MASTAHPELHLLLKKLQTIFDALLNFKPLAGVPPILDSSVDADPNDDGQWLRHENVPGIKKLRESIKFDIDILEKACPFLSNPASEHEQPISTHAPYLVAVYQELIEHASSVVSVFKFLQLNPSDGADRRERKGRRPPSTKVDVVADNGRRWIRINTIKNAGILAEFREIDSYLTDSESDSDDPERRPSLAQTQFDNSILQMGRVLIDAANANPIEGIDGPETPRVTLRLTRLDPSPVRANGEASDPRIAQTIQCLRDMGIDVELGERPERELPIPVLKAPKPPPGPLQPTRQINLDLSVLVALVSDLTHSPLPSSVEEATARFLPPQKYREWKPQERIAAEAPEPSSGLSQDIVKHSRALTTHILQEMGKGLLQEIHDKLFSGADPSTPKVEFWTSDEARERCMRIVSRIGGDREVRRAEALFPTDNISLSDAEALFWQDSRYPANFIPLLPIRLYPAPPLPPVQGIPEPHSRFFRSMTKVCRDLLAQEGASATAASIASNGRGLGDGDAQHTPAAKINSRLSPHAVKSMLRGAELGWTTLTTTKSSVKALLREIKAARLAGRLVEEAEDEDSTANEHASVAAIWIVDPRNLQCFV
ncbi:hypothetical protein C8F04DRAFT_1206760 [Mycena alexandri]|uniref:DUF1308 domain-containing protein n=1 Tax=Mycena alexandri TaxID=1745969 RepID=A0AAD6TJP9_9AGAR|nr:hypothetical protein C8F04DRAFT_1206760 [Mycena alexandri]